jgi:thiol-disulfide isomerase/thioredoxin
MTNPFIVQVPPMHLHQHAPNYTPDVPQNQFAQCITDSGAKFYGAFWCPHCQATKALFGKSAKKLPYIECSNPDQTQTQVCIDAKIEGYPTWEFADKTRVSGEQSFADLAAKTGCTAPTN